MRICKQVVDIIEIIVAIVLTIVKEIVETVCRWVTTIVKTVVEVAKKVCKWLPWPINKVCDWVTELVEVFTEVVEWVCEEVVVGVIVEVILRVFTYVFYVVRWVCWLVDLPFRLIDILFCVLGADGRRQINICVKILTDASGHAATTRDAVMAILKRAEALLDQCRISVCLVSLEFVEQDGLMSGVKCGASQFFGKAYSWFEKTSCVGSPKPLTLFFVDSMVDANACTIDGTSYVVLTDGANGASVVHEIGHHAELGHHDDPLNIMFVEPSDRKDQLTRWQCCAIRSSEFVVARDRCHSVQSLLARIAQVRDSYRLAEGAFPTE